MTNRQNWVTLYEEDIGSEVYIEPLMVYYDTLKKLKQLVVTTCSG